MPQIPQIKTITLGCRFNFYESEVSKAIIDKLQPKDNIIVINTCSVTHEAERQSKQAVRKAIRENPEAKIIVTGCAAKTALQYFENLDGVFKVIQNAEKTKPSEYFDIPHDSSNINFADDIAIEENNQLFENKSRAFIQIQNGCDHFCSYCIVPFTRGRSKSLPLDIILKRIHHFIEIGFKEIVLSGIDITSYGKDLDYQIDLSDVILAILKSNPELRRLRISSIDPKCINEKLFELFTQEHRIMPHFHLSIQSGDNDVLKAMRRRHTREDVIDICNKMLSSRKDIVFGSDFIVGFPTETELMFKNTLKLIDEAHLSLLHVFPYSPREGTIAAKMIQIPREVILNRASILRQKATGVKHNLFNSLLNHEISGIIEGTTSEYSFGKTDNFIPFKTKKILLPNNIIQGKVINFDKDALLIS